MTGLTDTQIYQTATDRGAWWRGAKNFMSTSLQVSAFLGILWIPGSWLWGAAIAQVEEKYQSSVRSIVSPTINENTRRIGELARTLDGIVEQMDAEREQSIGESESLRRIECLLELQHNPQLDRRSVPACQKEN